MSFGGGTDYNRGVNNLGGISKQATNDLFPAAFGQGKQELQAGGKAVNSGTNFFNTVLNGNRANTTAMLAPDINRVRDAGQQTLQATSTMSPRGGGRSGTLFDLPFQQNRQIQQMYGGARAGAGGQLADIGLQRMQAGGNLFNVGTNALNTGVGASTNISDFALKQKAASDAKVAALGKLAFGIGAAPFTGGASLLPSLKG